MIGNDLSAIQPSFVPPNLQFLVDDFEKGWVYREKFDLIHARTLLGCVGDWRWLMRQAYDHLKPHGYLEIAEFPIEAWSNDGSMTEENSHYLQYLKNLRLAGEKSGKLMDYGVITKFKQWMEEVGFEDVVEKVYVVPAGPWPKDPKLKELGRWMYAEGQLAVDSYGLRPYTQVLGWGQDEAMIHLALVKQELRNRSMRFYCEL